MLDELARSRMSGKRHGNRQGHGRLTILVRVSGETCERLRLECREDPSLPFQAKVVGLLMPLGSKTCVKSAKMRQKILTYN